MKTIAMVLTITAALSLLGAARPLSVSVPDGSGNVTITIGGAGAGDQALIAAWANGDNGDDPLDWTEYADAGTVAPSDTSKTFQIPAAWRAKSGAVRFFLMSGEKPYGKRFDCITRPNCNDGDLYIDTGIKPDSTLDISVTLKSDYMSSSSIMSPFGIHSVVFIMPKSDTEYYYDFFGAKTTTANGIMDDTYKNVFRDAPPHDAEPHTFRLNREGLFIDGYRHLAFDQSKITGSAATSTLTLFGRRGSWKQSGTTCSIFGATISTNGVLACDLVPVAAPSGKVQMWDRVTGGWKGPAGNQSGSLVFVAGNDIGPYPPDCGSVETVSSAINIGPSISVGSPNFSENTIAVTLSSGHDAGILLAVAGTNSESAAFSEWTTNAVVQKVAADVNEVSVSLPRKWIRENYNIRFAWKSISGANYDYAVESLASDGDGKAYIRTEWTPTTNTTTRVVSRTAFDTCPFGVAGGYYVFLGAKNANTKINWWFFTSASTGSNLTGQLDCDDPDGFASAFHVWQLGPRGVFIDDLNAPKAALAEFAPNASLTANICLPFRATSYNNHGNVSKAGDVETKGAKIWEGDVLVRDFIPCVTNGVPVFYDRVRGGYYGSRTATPFVAGAPVVADGDILSWSDVRSLRNGLAIFVR